MCCAAIWSFGAQRSAFGFEPSRLLCASDTTSNHMCRAVHVDTVSNHVNRLCLASLWLLAQVIAAKQAPSNTGEAQGRSSSETCQSLFMQADSLCPNGSAGGLKIHCRQLRVGSNPTADISNRSRCRPRALGSQRIGSYGYGNTHG